MADKGRYILCAGTVQPYVYRDAPFFMRHFARAEYERDKPVVSKSIREKAQPIIDRMNAGELSHDAGVAELERIYW